MDITSIAAAISSGKALKDILQGLATLKIENATLSQINEALNQVRDLQDALFNAREDLFRLQSENEKLRREIQDRNEWKTRIEGYKLEETSGGAVVYGSATGSPKHYACPRCVEKHEIQILQDLNVASGAFECPGCKASYGVKPMQEVQIHTGGRPNFF